MTTVIHNKILIVLKLFFERLYELLDPIFKESVPIFGYHIKGLKNSEYFLHISNTVVLFLDTRDWLLGAGYVCPE